MANHDRTLLREVLVVLNMIGVRMRVENVSDRLVRDTPNLSHDLIVKDGEIRIHEKNAIVSREDHHVPTRPRNYISLPGNVPHDDVYRRDSLGVGRLESAIIGDWTTLGN